MRRICLAIASLSVRRSKGVPPSRVLGSNLEAVLRPALSTADPSFVPTRQHLSQIRVHTRPASGVLDSP